MAYKVSSVIMQKITKAPINHPQERSGLYLLRERGNADVGAHRDIDFPSFP